MSRPDDVPEDVWGAVRNVLGLDMLPSDNTMFEVPPELIARAILAEREAQKERDAKIADHCATEWGGVANRIKNTVFAGMADSAQHIAAAIRKGTP